MSGDLAKTPLHAWHAAHGARLVDFAGWSMPVQYSSIVDEHHATRRGVGLFDVSHMGRLRIEGSDAATFLDRVVTRKVLGMGVGKIRYSLVCREDGGILDDILVYHLAAQEFSAPATGNYHFLVVNASNREKIVAWLNQQKKSGEQVQIVDQTLATAMIAVQGPKAIELLQPLCPHTLSGMGYYTGCETTIGGHAAIVSRTGYTGEDGCEVIVSTAAALEIWEKLMADGKSVGTMAAGLGARDTLRLEAAMPLYGHELGEEINPIAAGLSFAVGFEGREFISKTALLVAKDNSTQKVRVGLEIAGRRAAREHYDLFAATDATTKIGFIASGTFSPTLQKPIAMAYIDPAYSAVGTILAVDIRGSQEQATVVPMPFYVRGKTPTS